MEQSRVYFSSELYTHIQQSPFTPPPHTNTFHPTPQTHTHLHLPTVTHPSGFNPTLTHSNPRSEHLPPPHSGPFTLPREGSTSTQTNPPDSTASRPPKSVSHALSNNPHTKPLAHHLCSSRGPEGREVGRHSVTPYIFRPQRTPSNT